MHLDKILVDEKQPADLIHGRIVIKCPTLAGAAVEFQKLSPCEQNRVLMKSAGFTYTRDEIARLCYAKHDLRQSSIVYQTAQESGQATTPGPYLHLRR